MLITEEYRRLMYFGQLPDRFRAGDYFIDEDEEAILKEFVDNFYTSVENNGCVTLEDFTEFMDFLDLLRDADTDEVQNVVTWAFVKRAKLQKRSAWK